ncbi:MAG: pyruvate kinase [Candidatus Paceibacteria bacterium]
MDIKTQIVATIGPATKDVETIKNLIQNGMKIARLNFSWGTYEEHREYIKNIRSASQELSVSLPIIQDLSGPRIQSGAGHEFNQSAISPLTEKDIADLKFGIDEGVDYVALSYVGEALHVRQLKQEMEKLGKVLPVIAKIERVVALENLPEIVDEADAVMVARGDLGNELPLAKIPFAERDIIALCKKNKKPVIVATQVLLSMTENPVPTRAEMTDVVYAVLEGTDAIMLSEETAVGKYPREAVHMMALGIKEAEGHVKEVQINNF